MSGVWKKVFSGGNRGRGEKTAIGALGSPGLGAYFSWDGAAFRIVVIFAQRGVGEVYDASRKNSHPCQNLPRAK